MIKNYGLKMDASNTNTEARTSISNNFSTYQGNDINRWRFNFITKVIICNITDKCIYTISSEIYIRLHLVKQR